MKTPRNLSVKWNNYNQTTKHLRTTLSFKGTLRNRKYETPISSKESE